MAQYKLKQLGDAAKELQGQGSALAAPMDSEVQGLNEKQAQVDALKAADTSQPADVHPAMGGTPINKSAHYGDRPGEKRIDVNSMLSPLGSARAHGGPVEADKPYVVGEEGPEVIVPKEEGEVVPNEGAPADFGGPVYPNPKNLKPMLDTESPEAPAKASVGMDTSNPQAAELIPGQEQGPEKVKGKLSTTTLSGSPVSATGTPAMKPLGGGAHEALATAKAAQDVDVAKQRDIIEGDKKVAASKGADGLVDLGLARIHEDALNKTHPPAGQEVDASGLPVKENEKAPSMTAEAPDASGLPVQGNAEPGLGKMTIGKPVDAHANLEQKREELKKVIEGPDTEAAGVATRQLAELNKNNPWGTAGNHPGALGKIAHGLAKAGNIAGDIVAPSVMANIPGTDMNRMQQRHFGLEEEAQGAQNNLEAAQAKAALAKTVPFNAVEELNKANTALRAAKTPEEKTAAQAKVDDLTNAIAKNQPPKDVDLKQQLLDSHDKEAQLRASGDAAGADAEKAHGQRIEDSLTAAQAGPKDTDRAKYVQKYLNDNKLEDTAENESKANQAYTDATQKAPVVGVVETPSGLKVASARPGETLPSGTSSLADVSKQENKYYTYVDDKGNVQYGQGKEIPEGTQRFEQDPKTFPNEFHRANVVQESVNTLWKDVDEHPEIFDNGAARAVLSAATADMDTQFGALVGGTGGSMHVPKTLTEDLKAALQNHTLDQKTADAVKDYVTDLTAAKDKALAIQMDLQGGKIGKGNAQAFNAIVQQMPYGATPDSRQAKRALERLQGTMTELNSKFPDKLGASSRVKPYTPGTAQNQEKQKTLQSITLSDGTHPKDVKYGPNGHIIVWRGIAGEGWIDPATMKPIQ